MFIYPSHSVSYSLINAGIISGWITFLFGATYSIGSLRELIELLNPQATYNDIHLIKWSFIYTLNLILSITSILLICGIVKVSTIAENNINKI